MKGLAMGMSGDNEYWVPECVREYLRGTGYSTRALYDMGPHVREWGSWMLAISAFDGNNNAHATRDDVRGGSDWESTLKPRLRERLRSSKNIILFLSSSTTASHAPTEEIEYGIGNQELPAIVVYPDFDPIDWSGRISDRAKSLWNSLPAFKRLMGQVPTLHAPMKKEALANALTDPDFMVSTKTTSGCYRL